CDEILHYGGMGHTASIHTRNRDAALRYGILMPAARVVVNTPSTHGAIGFSTALPPSMTLGCGAPGKNIIGDNITAARVAGLRIGRHQVQVFGLSGGLAGLAGLVQMGRINAADPETAT
ncbi:MAG: acetaldehyde dehydrogenase, partial [Planctomycetes bacterium]|nr:acetaldehyde dehydrogenase [Planctomycetota bacterium]